MVTPQYLDSLTQNKVVEMYQQLNNDICVSIIKRIDKMGNISEATRKQLKVMLQTNGKEVFEEVLLKSASLNAQTKNELKNIYENMAKTDMKGYEELFDYRDMPFKLSASQYQILNNAIKITSNELKNFTKSIAFASKELYINAVDKAYAQVITGAFDYNKAIYNAYKEVAEKGVTLQDKAGRNVQLDVAVRRNILTGVQQTANDMNRDIEKELGCDGYEVTTTPNCRDSHKVMQGKQFALTKKDAEKYKVGLWKDVKELLNDYGCQHTYFGIILGLSEPVYTKKEVEKINNITVNHQGEKIPYNEAVSNQRYIERTIRNYKRQVEILKETGNDYKKEKDLLSKWQKKYRNYNNETGLTPDYARTRV